jgi:putative transposase
MKAGKRMTMSMSRYPQLYAPGGYFYVMLRGVVREHIFRDGADRAQFYVYLEEAIERFQFRLNVFCLMTTHVHLVLRQGLQTVGKVIHRLAFRYARRFNDRWGRRGHLFGDRFKGVLVQQDNHLVALVRYVHLKPVRAGMVFAPKSTRGVAIGTTWGSRWFPG